MRIVFDNIIYSLQRYGGVSVVWNNLISRIAASGHDVCFVEYDDADSNIAHQQLNLSKEKVSRSRSYLMPVRRYFNPRLPQTITNTLADTHDQRFIFHSSYFRICEDPRAINVTTVHDFTYELFVHNWMKRNLHCRQKHAAIRQADHVVCISENTRQDLLRILPDVDPSKVSVINNGVENKCFHSMPEIVNEDFALFVGRRDEYKNFLTILQPLAELHIPLRIVGPALNQQELAALKKTGIDYQYLGLVSDEELNCLYNKALFLCYPSLYEGFGLPVLEAQMAGCPVLAFNASSIPEIIGDPQLMVNDLTTTSIAAKVELFSNPVTRSHIIADGLANASQYTWENMADAYLKLYEQLLA